MQDKRRAERARGRRLRERHSPRESACVAAARRPRAGSAASSSPGCWGRRRHGSASAAAAAPWTPACGKPAAGAGPRADDARAAEPGQERLPHQDLGRQQQVGLPPPASARCVTRKCAMYVRSLPAARAAWPSAGAHVLTLRVAAPFSIGPQVPRRVGGRQNDRARVHDMGGWSPL